MVKILTVNGQPSNLILTLSDLDNLIANSFQSDIIKYVELTNPERVIKVRGARFN